MNTGFTLVELLVTIAVVAILSAGIVMLIGQAPSQTARDGHRKTDLQQVSSAMELYRNKNGSYPPCIAGADSCQVNAAGIPNLTSPYISTLPTDPVSTAYYRYAPKPTTCDGVIQACTSYLLCAHLETGSGSTPCSVSGTYCASGATGFCNYQITNP